MAVAPPELSRPLVPSQREVDSGRVPEYEYVPEPAETLAGPARPRRDPRAYLRSLDPRVVAREASLLPVGVFLASLAFVAMQIDGYGVIAPQIQDSFGVSVGFVITFLGLVQFLAIATGPLFGYLADRVRRIWMLRASFLMLHGAFALSGTATSIPALVATKAVATVGQPVASAVMVPLLTDYYPPKVRGRIFSLLYVSTPIGLVLGPALLGGIADLAGWRLAVIVVGLLGLAASLGVFLLREPVRGRLDRMAMGADSAAAAREQRAVSWSEGWRAAGSIRTLRRLWWATPFTYLGATLNYTYSSLHLSNDFGLGPGSIGLILSLTAIPALLGLLLAGPLVDHYLQYKPGRYMAAFGTLVAVSGVAYVGFILSPNLPLALVILPIPTFVSTLVLPGLNTMTAMVVPARMRGFGLTTLNVFQCLGLLLAPVVGAIANSAGLTAALLMQLPLGLTAALIMGTGGKGVDADIRAALAASMADEEARRARESGRNKLLICRDVDVTYDGAQVLFGVDLDVEEGEIVALLGTNGAGKSTLLRAVCGVQEASNGAVFVDGDDVTHMPADQIAERGVVMMPGGRAVFPTLTVAENLRAAAWLHRQDEEHVAARTAEVLDLFPALRDRMHTQAGNMSGGEQQMLALGQALLMKPRLLMIDELSLGLAPQVVERLLGVLRRIHAEGTTIIVVEQSIHVALSIAERAVYMERGEIRFDGPTRELLQRGDVVHSVFLGGAVTSSLGNTSRAFGPGDQAEDTVVRVRDLHVRQGEAHILRGVSMQVAAREVVGIIGPNGAGKTTVFDALSGFAPVAEGSVEFTGRDVTQLAPDARARLGMARSFQNVRLFPALTVRENIAVALERHLQSRSAVLAAAWSPQTRSSERRVWRRVDNLVDSLGLGPHAGKFMNELSTGTRRIVDIACLLAAGPKLLLLDEPSSGLAQAETEMLAPVVDRIVAEIGCGILIIEHDLGLVAAVADRLIAMRLGTVMAEGAPADVLDDQQVIEALLGGASDAVLSRSIQLVTTESTTQR